MKPSVPSIPSVLCLLSLAAGCALPRRQAQSLHLLETFQSRPDGLVRRETWRDKEGGGGFFLFTDPQVQAMSALHSNQAALGGGSLFTTGPISILVDTNTARVIQSAGAAVGNVIGAAARSGLK